MAATSILGVQFDLAWVIGMNVNAAVFDDVKYNQGAQAQVLEILQLIQHFFELGMRDNPYRLEIDVQLKRQHIGRLIEESRQRLGIEDFLQRENEISDLKYNAERWSYNFTESGLQRLAKERMLKDKEFEMKEAERNGKLNEYVKEQRLLAKTAGRSLLEREVARELEAKMAKKVGKNAAQRWGKRVAKVAKPK